MKNIQDHYNKYGNVVASSYFQRYQKHFDSILVPFGALLEFLPSSHIQKETTSKMAPNTIPRISIGYYEDINGLSKDYVVISLAFLGDAKGYPNDRTSWRLTPQRVGRLYFNTQREPQFPLKPAYDVRRESILIQ